MSTHWGQWLIDYNWLIINNLLISFDKVRMSFSYRESGTGDYGTLLPYYERITDLPPLFFPCRPDLKWRHNVFTTTATCLPNRMFGLTCFRIRYPINFHKHRYSVRIMFNMWGFHDAALSATMIKMHQFNEKMWQQEFIKKKHSVKIGYALWLCAATHVIIVLRQIQSDSSSLLPAWC